MSKKTFLINNNFYPHDIIQNAIIAFGDYNITSADGTLSIEDEDPQYIFDELMNYTLSLSLEIIP
jgi:hypothetical protein